MSYIQSYLFEDATVNQMGTGILWAHIQYIFITVIESDDGQLMM